PAARIEQRAVGGPALLEGELPERPAQQQSLLGGAGSTTRAVALERCIVECPGRDDPVRFGGKSQLRPAGDLWPPRRQRRADACELRCRLRQVETANGNRER